MNAKQKVIFSFILFCAGFATCYFTGRLGIAKVKAELDRGTNAAQYLETLNKREGDRIQREGEILSDDRKQFAEERIRFGEERINLARARENLERERARLPAEFDAYNRIEKILTDGIELIKPDTK